MLLIILSNVHDQEIIHNKKLDDINEIETLVKVKANSNISVIGQYSVRCTDQ